ncbi:MAG: BON domain-containing protein [Bryobacteraceae bacterium]
MRSTTLAWVLLALFAGPALPAAKPVSSKSTESGRRAGLGSDVELETKIRSRFARSKIASDGLKVTVKDGVATITGRTEILQHKGAATRMARSAGAVRVDNKVEISEAARQKAVANLSKGRSGSTGSSEPAPKH